MDYFLEESNSDFYNYTGRWELESVDALRDDDKLEENKCSSSIDKEIQVIFFKLSLCNLSNVQSF
jgi:hypothetical protein